MAPIDLGSYKSIYLQTAKEYIDNLVSSFTKLSVNPQDNDAINTVHISSHSLRSQSQVMGHQKIADLCVSIEKISSDILGKIRTADDEFMSILKNSIDELNSELSQIEKQ